MAKYVLVSKGAKEIIDVQMLNNLNEAKEYFQKRKRFEDKQTFDKLYEVKEEKKEQQKYRNFR